MKKLIIVLLVLASNLTMAQSIRVITYNIRFNNPDDGVNAWPNRSKQVAALLAFHQADVFGLQEALFGQIEDIQAQLPEMEWIGVARDDGEKSGEFSPLFYNAKKFEAVQKGWFWLSENPENPGLGWDAACNRICTWAILKELKGNQQYLILNTHFDHKGDLARIESAKLILQKIKEINKADLPVILTGDFNLTPEQEPIELISEELNDSKTTSNELPYGPSGTFNGFDFNSPLKERIDYIFVNNKIEVKQYGVLSDSKDQKYPSDHLPVFVNLVVNK